MPDGMLKTSSSSRRTEEKAEEENADLVGASSATIATKPLMRTSIKRKREANLGLLARKSKMLNENKIRKQISSLLLKDILPEMGDKCPSTSFLKSYKIPKLKNRSENDDRSAGFVNDASADATNEKSADATNGKSAEKSADATTNESADATNDRTAEVTNDVSAEAPKDCHINRKFYFTRSSVASKNTSKVCPRTAEDIKMTELNKTKPNCPKTRIKNSKKKAKQPREEIHNKRTASTGKQEEAPKRIKLGHSIQEENLNVSIESQEPILSSEEIETVHVETNDRESTCTEDAVFSLKPAQPIHQDASTESWVSKKFMNPPVMSPHARSDVEERHWETESISPDAENRIQGIFHDTVYYTGVVNIVRSTIKSKDEVRNENTIDLDSQKDEEIIVVFEEKPEIAIVYENIPIVREESGDVSKESENRSKSDDDDVILLSMVTVKDGLHDNSHPELPNNEFEALTNASSKRILEVRTVSSRSEDDDDVIFLSKNLQGTHSSQNTSESELLKDAEALANSEFNISDGKTVSSGSRGDVILHVEDLAVTDDDLQGISKPELSNGIEATPRSTSNDTCDGNSQLFNAFMRDLTHLKEMNHSNSLSVKELGTVNGPKTVSENGCGSGECSAYFLLDLFSAFSILDFDYNGINIIGKEMEVSENLISTTPGNEDLRWIMLIVRKFDKLNIIKECLKHFGSFENLSGYILGSEKDIDTDLINNISVKFSEISTSSQPKDFKIVPPTSTDVCQLPYCNPVSNVKDKSPLQPFQEVISYNSEEQNSEYHLNISPPCSSSQPLVVNAISPGEINMKDSSLNICDTRDICEEIPKKSKKGKVKAKFKRQLLEKIPSVQPLLPRTRSDVLEVCPAALLKDIEETAVNSSSYNLLSANNTCQISSQSLGLLPVTSVPSDPNVRKIAVETANAALLKDIEKTAVNSSSDNLLSANNTRQISSQSLGLLPVTSVPSGPNVRNVAVETAKLLSSENCNVATESHNEKSDGDANSSFDMTKNANFPPVQTISSNTAFNEHLTMHPGLSSYNDSVFRPPDFSSGLTSHHLVTHNNYPLQEIYRFPPTDHELRTIHAAAVARNQLLRSGCMLPACMCHLPPVNSQNFLQGCPTVATCNPHPLPPVNAENFLQGCPTVAACNPPPLPSVNPETFLQGPPTGSACNPHSVPPVNAENFLQGCPKVAACKPHPLPPVNSENFLQGSPKVADCNPHPFPPVNPENFLQGCPTFAACIPHPLQLFNSHSFLQGCPTVASCIPHPLPPVNSQNVVKRFPTVQHDGNYPECMTSNQGSISTKDDSCS